MHELLPLIISLIDPIKGEPIQTWKFLELKQISIGRSVKCDVSIGHSLVSREHVSIIPRGGTWHLTSTGRHGTLVNGDIVFDCTVGEKLRIQLGNAGPVLEILHGIGDGIVNDTLEEDQDDGPTTMYLDGSFLNSLKVDEKKMEQEVDSIAENEQFSRLKEQARLLRESRDKEL